MLDQVAERAGAAVVLLGHTRDDQAETVLLGLTRGSGGRSVAGMRRAFDRYRRPLLDVSRDDTVTACQVQGIEFWEDPHNHDPGFTRVRVRRTVLPLLEQELGPGVATTLARTADQLRDDMDLLDDLAEADWVELRDEDGSLPVDPLAGRPGPVRRRVLRLAALAAGAPSAELFHDHVLAHGRPADRLARPEVDRPARSPALCPSHGPAALPPTRGARVALGCLSSVTEDRGDPVRRVRGCLIAVVVATVASLTVGVTPAVAADAVSTAPPTITGVVAVGQTAHAEPGAWDREGLDFTYGWLLDGAPVDGATGPDYVPPATDQGPPAERARRGGSGRRAGRGGHVGRRHRARRGARGHVPAGHHG